MIARFDVYVPDWGMTIRDCVLFGKNNNQWVSLPSKPYQADGQTKYFEMVTLDKERKTQFDKQCIAEINLIPPELK